MKATNKFPPGWDESQVREVLDHYESQTADEAATEVLAEDEPWKRSKWQRADILVKGFTPMISL